MTRQDDIAINCAVRRVLVRHFIDLGRICIRTTRGAVTITGTLERLINSPAPLNAGIVTQIFDEIGRLNHVRRVLGTLTNWASKEGAWMPVVDTPSHLPVPSWGQHGAFEITRKDLDGAGAVTRESALSANLPR
jgi:hypothetical protein